MSAQIFWISISILFYCYLGYGLLVFFLNNIKVLFTGRKSIEITEWPAVSLIISAYNENDILEQKITNTLSIDYPTEKLKVIVVTDGSGDGSENIVKQYGSIQSLHKAEREGKTAALKRAMKHVDTPYVVFSDANTMLNTECLKKIIAHYKNKRTGAVAGEKKILQNNNFSAVGEAEGIYWQYESFMKKMDAELYTVVGAAGELFSIRTSLYKEPDDKIILDDFVLSMMVCLQGYRIAYEPGAFATESPSASFEEERKRKVRISAGAYQSIGYLRQCLNIFKYPALSFQYISRRLLRWTACPLLLVIVLVCNVVLAVNSNNGLYQSLLLTQLIFYLFAFAGWLFALAGKRAGLFTIPFYFVFMHYCLVSGFVKFVRGKHSVLWEKSTRIR
ncbi:MAG: glycosyltransferase family 2 protein [Chitinophagaceae bacterium]|nr:glycosyltransferase family 2 protein [Chitinophagaceae bacterium]